MALKTSNESTLRNEFLEQGKYKKVIVIEISRFSRRAKDIRSTIKLYYYGIGVIFKNLGCIKSLQDCKKFFVTNIFNFIKKKLKYLKIY